MQGALLPRGSGTVLPGQCNRHAASVRPARTPLQSHARAKPARWIAARSPKRRRAAAKVLVRASDANGDNAKLTADVQLAPRAAAMTREEVLATIREEAPLVITREALADKFTYTPSLDFPVGEGAASYCVYMMHLRSVLAQELPGYKLEVTREFQPEPSKLIVRWTITWEGENGPGVANGSSTFRLNDDGLVAEAEDLWEVEGETGDGAYFGRCFEFALALRPGGMRKLQWESLNTAMKLAGWEALKNSPMYGGQMTREELDVLITQSMYAVGGLVVSISLLMAVVASKLLFH